MPTTSAIQWLSTRGETDALLDLRTEAQRRLVLDKLDAMLRIESGIVSGLSRRNAIETVARMFTGRRGFSVGNLTKDFALWQNGGRKTDPRGQRCGAAYEARDWHIFVPGYNNGQPSAALANAVFVRYVRQLHADTCRVDATGNALQARLLDEWFAGRDIPGYGNIRDWNARRGQPVPADTLRRPCYYPTGWSPDNLRRMLPQSRSARALVQRGEHAAHDAWGEQLLRDRSKLMPFQLVAFDDVRFDLRVIQPMPGGKAQAVMPVAVFALDVATGLVLAKGVVGSYTRETDGDGGTAGTKRAIQQADVRFLLHSILERFGLPVDWKMRVLLENASASLNETDRRVFERLTGVEFETTGLVHRKLVKSGFVEQGGMPWQKGWIEAFFRLLHCRMNHLDGTIGARYQLTPGGLDEKVRYALRIVEEARAKDVPLTSLQLPILTMDEFNELLDEYVLRLNWRISHKLQGFKRVFEVEAEPGVFLRHDDPRAAEFIRDGTPLNVRNEAPAERFERLMQGHRMQRVHPRQLLPLALDKRPVSVRSGKVTLYRAGQDNLLFHDAESAAALDAFDGREKALLGFLAADQSCIHLFTNDERLRYVASPRNVRRVDVTDRHAILCRAGEVDRGRNRIRVEVADLLAPRENRFAAMRSSNDAVLRHAGTNGNSVANSIADALAGRQRLSAHDRRHLDEQAALLVAETDKPDANDGHDTAASLLPDLLS
jgi:hypothetical protein